MTASDIEVALVAANRRAQQAEERIEGVGSLASDLLAALQPWQFHAPEVRSAATRLTVALAAIPLPEHVSAEAPKND